MRLEQSFDVAAPVAAVWEALIDLERVAPCLPGAQITDHDEDGTYRGTFAVKLGATRAEYRGTIRISAADAAAHRAELSARGTDKRGQGGASATIVAVLAEQEDVTRVQVETDFSITGRLARFGRGGMVEDVSKALMRDFAACLAQRLAGEPEAPSGADVAAGIEAPEAAAAAAPDAPPPDPAP